MRSSLSILIPTRNDRCAELVGQLKRQADTIEGLDYEIIVADDGSTDTGVIAANKAVDSLDNCRYIIKGENIGRAAIRNYLARQAQKKWLLFVDADMSIISNNFLQKYLAAKSDFEVFYGGYKVMGKKTGNLRYTYEKRSERKHSWRKRRLHPYLDFHTSNFMTSRKVMLEHPLNERFRGYGYEDVAFGKALREAGIGIWHLNNPVGFGKFETNSDFIAKTEESLRTLKTYRDELRDYSRIIKITDKLRNYHLLCIVCALFERYHNKWRKRLCAEKHAPLWLFNIYKLGYFAR